MVVKIATEPEAKEQLVVILLILTVVEFILFNLVENCKILESISAELGPK